MSEVVASTMLSAIGGRAALDVVVHDFYRRVLADRLLRKFFEGVDLPSLEKKQADFFEAVLGGRGQADGRAMAQAHAKHAIEPRHFDRVAQHLRSALRGAGVLDELIEVILGKVGGLRGVVVNTPDRVVAFLDAVQPHISAVASHSVYRSVSSIERLRTFVEHHVFAVWDFMCLLKALQRVVTCVDVPWRPVGDPATRRFINEIVLGEESDLIGDRVVSHFELYLEAMETLGANTVPIRAFIREVEAGRLISSALEIAHAPAAARAFVLSTMDVVHMNRAHAIAAVFTAGREKAIPAMFRQLIAQIAGPSSEAGRRLFAREPFAPFLQYLDRHIEVDDGSHGPLAMELVASLCGTDATLWNEAMGAAITALQARARLWDAVVGALQ